MGYPCLCKNAIVTVFVPALKSVQVGTQKLHLIKLIEITTLQIARQLYKRLI